MITCSSTGFVIVFSLTDRQSFEYTAELHDQVRHNRSNVARSLHG
jgi:hypothetical protein